MFQCLGDQLPNLHLVKKLIRLIAIELIHALVKLKEVIITLRDFFSLELLKE